MYHTIKPTFTNYHFLIFSYHLQLINMHIIQYLYLNCCFTLDGNTDLFWKLDISNFCIDHATKYLIIFISYRIMLYSSKHSINLSPHKLF